MIGVAHTSNVLEKATYILAGLIFALTLAIAFRIEKKRGGVREESVIVERLENMLKKKRERKKYNK